MNKVFLKSNLDFAVVFRSLTNDKVVVSGYFRFWVDAAQYARSQSEESVYDFVVIERSGEQAYYRYGVRKSGMLVPALIEWED